MKTKLILIYCLIGISLTSCHKKPERTGYQKMFIISKTDFTVPGKVYFWSGLPEPESWHEYKIVMGKDTCWMTSQSVFETDKVVQVPKECINDIVN